MASFGKPISESATCKNKKSFPGKLGKVKGVKGTFGHARSRDGDGKLFSLDRRTLSESSSDVRFPLPDANAMAMAMAMSDMSEEVFEPNSNSSVPSDADALAGSSSSNPNATNDSINEFSRRGDHQSSCHFKYLDEDDDEFSVSVGLPSDLPSGLVDIEGDIIGDRGNVRFGQDDEEMNDLNEDDDELSSLPDDFNYSGPTSRNSRTGGKRSNKNKMPKSKSKSKPKKPLPDFRNPHQFNTNGFIQLRSHRGRPTRANSGGNNNNNELGRDGLRRKSATASSCSNSTITQHYYPEGGWGYVVLVMAFLSHALLCGIHLSSGVVIWAILKNFNFNGAKDKEVSLQDAGWLTALSIGISLFLSPIWVSICKRKSTRLTAVFGSLVASLGLLFTSFASQFHQLFFSYAIFIGIGVGLTRDASSLMVGQYFKRKRDLVEVILVSASGFGIFLMSTSIHTSVSSLGWRLGLQAITGTVFITFFLGSCYRSASLYHPQRRAILHLKNQKRKVQEKEKLDDQPPFLDLSCLRSKTLQILLLSSGFTAFGINTPLFYLAIERDNGSGAGAANEKLLLEGVGLGLGPSPQGPIEFSLVILYTGIGISWIVGSFLYGLILVQKNQECRISRQYLCQIAGVISGISILALATTVGFNGLIIFACVYGFSLGGYNYALKVYTYERVRARHFPRAWSFVQSSQAIPLLLGVPLAGYLNTHVGGKSGYYMSALSVIIGSAFLFLTDVRKRRLSRRKAKSASLKTLETSISAQTPKPERLSFSFPVEQMSPQGQQAKIESIDEDGQCIGLDPALLAQEISYVSEEDLPGLNLQDMYFEEWADYLGGDCITSCNKVEDCLVSEFNADHPGVLNKRPRRWSTAKSSLILQAGGIGAAAVAVAGGIIGMGPIGQNIEPNTSANAANSEAATEEKPGSDEKVPE